MSNFNRLRSQLFNSKQNDRLFRALSKLPGVKLTDAFSGRLTTSGQSAQMLLEPGERIRCSLAIDNPFDPRHALATNITLPGNVRFAIGSKGPALLADTGINGEVHLPTTFGQIRSGFKQAVTAQARRRRREQLVTVEQVKAAVDQIKWPDDAIVEHEQRWELRPRIHGEAVPVQVTLDDGELRLHRNVLSPLPDGIQGDAIAVQSLRFNSQLRQARLGLEDKAIISEARLHRDQITSAWLCNAARAVAVSSKHVQIPLRILCEQEGVAKQFLKIFSKDVPSKR